MTTPIQEPLRAQELVAALGLKGRVELELDETVVPVIDLGAPGDSPYNRVRNSGFASVSSLSVLARNSCAVLQAGPGHIVGLTHVYVRNQTAGVLEYTVTWLTAAQLAAINLGAAVRFTATNPWNQTGVPHVQLAPTMTPGDAAAVTGIVIARTFVPATTTDRLTLPRPPFLYGDNANVGALAVFCETVNTTLNAYMFIDQYRVSS